MGARHFQCGGRRRTDFLGSFAVAAHKTHAYSVYVELKQQNVLVERPDYDVEKRLRTMAAGGRHSYSIASMGAGICIANALAIGLFWKRWKRERTGG